MKPTFNKSEHSFFQIPKTLKEAMNIKQQTDKEALIELLNRFKIDDFVDVEYEGQHTVEIFYNNGTCNLSCVEFNFDKHDSFRDIHGA